MALTITLSDGTTTIDLYDGSDSVVREGGLNMPPPLKTSSYHTSPFYHGARLAQASYDYRTITITTKIWGSTLADLQTNIRSINRLLNDARERTLLGYGSQVYLEYQWAEVVGESVYFDVMDGELAMPADYMQVLLTQKYHIIDAMLTLTCQPFGRYTNQTVAQAVLENEDYGANHNYMDIATAAAFGDVPAKMYIKVALANATGAKKLWIAKRSGTRQTDDLWIQGEDENSTTDIVDSVHKLTFTDENDAALSGEKYKRIKLELGDAIAAAAEISRFNYTISTLPKGQFRVLIYCRTTETSVVTEFAKMGWALGWSYGDRSYTPVQADGDYIENAADDTWEILDLGVLNIPPVAESDIASNNDLELRIYQVVTEALADPDNWTNPTGNNDLGAWQNEGQAYNDNTGDAANENNVANGAWSGEIEFTHAAMDSAGINIWVSMSEAGNNPTVHVEGFYGGAYHVLGEEVVAVGGYHEMLWTDTYHNITKYKVKMKNNCGQQANMQINEIDFQLLSEEYHWDMDYIFLLPIDEGVVIIDDVDAADLIAIDSIADPPGVFIISAASKIEDYPDYVGKPFDLGRENTRLYMLRDDVKGVTFTTDITFQPQFMVI